MAVTEEVAREKAGSASLNGSHDNGRDIAAAEGQQYLDDEAVPVCPPNTTERKLLTRIDLHVMPFLCVMYLLAFLGMLLRT